MKRNQESRLFLALQFDADAVRKITAVQQKLKEYTGGSYPPAENLHMTLAFLGNIRNEEIDMLKEILHALPAAPSPLFFDHIGCFPSKKGKHVYLGIMHSDALFLLEKELIMSLQKNGFAVEEEQFVPHVTLCRRAEGEFMERDVLEHGFSARVEDIALLKSEQIEGKRIYTVLDQVNGEA